MLNYVLSTSQDEMEPKAAKHLIEELIKAFPEKPARQTIMTFAEQLKEEYKQEAWHEVAKSLLATGMPIEQVRKLTKLPDLDLTALEKI